MKYEVILCFFVQFQSLLAQQNIWPESCVPPCANNELQVVTMMTYNSICPERLENHIGFISEEQACSFDIQVNIHF